MRLLGYYFIGLIFGVGIAISGMINPAKVINFFDIAGHWDPSLAFVMTGAVLVTFIGYRVVWRRKSPLLGGRFHIPTIKDIDANLIIGAAVFGVGWGMTGFCPGAALPALGLARIEVVAFVIALCTGIVAARYIMRRYLDM